MIVGCQKHLQTPKQCLKSNRKRGTGAKNTCECSKNLLVELVGVKSTQECFPKSVVKLPNGSNARTCPSTAFFLEVKSHGGTAEETQTHTNIKVGQGNSVPRDISSWSSSNC